MNQGVGSDMESLEGIMCAHSIIRCIFQTDQSGLNVEMVTEGSDRGRKTS